MSSFFQLKSNWSSNMILFFSNWSCIILGFFSAELVVSSFYQLKLYYLLFSSWTCNYPIFSSWSSKYNFFFPAQDEITSFFCVCFPAEEILWGWGLWKPFEEQQPGPLCRVYPRSIQCPRGGANSLPLRHGWTLRKSGGGCGCQSRSNMGQGHCQKSTGSAPYLGRYVQRQSCFYIFTCKKCWISPQVFVFHCFTPGKIHQLKMGVKGIKINLGAYISLYTVLRSTRGLDLHVRWFTRGAFKIVAAGLGYVVLQILNDTLASLAPM